MNPEVGVAAVLTRPGPSGKEILLVQRQHPPQAGYWALPGGHVEFGESIRDAIKREIQEELMVTVSVGALLYIAELIGEHYHFVVLDYAVEVQSGQLRAGSDAAAMGWYGQNNLARLPLAAGMGQFFQHPDIVRFLEWG
ncbi:MAG: hypothetical protein C7B46_00085 [Sulfobacillus benefaciens]|uniref:Nudix hydrolase domain-containing protein n=1 Tax=Sulfobacillus benefaciens TaxID=453960 RepID=A0A2T2XLW8_9FIRM|nr:MAG: hypothetical protein C7B46_00085 [Sulfobacillus benefaciens]